ncbi:MAG TPA: helix-turn-helix transcriptional regulator [Blastocatellia bacterium]|nr:helix-turn-helix transcriptional regulator [Blastocatellia bacterium]
METLAEYLARLIRQKRLTPKELSRLSGLTDSYIGRVCKGQSDNLTVDTIKKLADALEVNAHEIFARASGVPVSEDEPIDVALLFDQLQTLASDSNGIDALKLFLSLSAGEKKKLFGYVKHLRSRRPKGKPRKPPKGS